jgi:hypothetical protein
LFERLVLIDMAEVLKKHATTFSIEKVDVARFVRALWAVRCLAAGSSHRKTLGSELA